jgi:hypothetical protein
MVKRRWSFKDDRRLMELARASTSHRRSFYGFRRATGYLDDLF